MRKSAFIDEVEITVAGGCGGGGIVSFLREKSRPDGGPNGGDGGAGGSVQAVATRAVNTLLEFKYRRRVAAANGGRGMGKSRHGKNGADTVIQVPLGTRITDSATGFLHADLTCEGQTALLASGGAGGLGNEHFKTSTNRAPRTATAGQAGEVRQFTLALALLADVGLLGAPNAGKSTFLRALTDAHAKTGDYPFTTTQPQLGVITPAAVAADDADADAITIADIPGLVRGASSGAGLGNRFLRHLARTALLCHVVDISQPDAVETCRMINCELAKTADAALAKKPQWLILNKTDLISPAAVVDCKNVMQKNFPFFERVFAVSAFRADGTQAVAQALVARHAATATATTAAASAPAAAAL